MSDHDKKVPEEGGGDVAVIGEGTPNRMPVSIQVLQGIYHELTGKTEEVSKSYSAGFQITHDALEQPFRQAGGRRTGRRQYIRFCIKKLNAGFTQTGNGLENSQRKLARKPAARSSYPSSGTVKL